MYCKNCNNEVPEGNTFCPFCGERLLIEEALHRDVESTQEESAEIQTPIENTSADIIHFSSDEEKSAETIDEENTDDTTVEASNIKKKKSRGKLIALIVVAFIAVACISGFVLLPKFSKISVDLSSLIADPVVEGFDGSGSLFVEDLTLDPEKASIWISSQKEKKQGDCEAFLQSIVLGVDKSENLSNGDTLLITASYDENLANSYNIVVTNTTKEVAIGGLKERPKEITAEDVAASGLVEQFISYYDDSDVSVDGIYFGKSYSGNRIFVITSCEAAYDDEDMDGASRNFYIDNTGVFTDSLDGVQIITNALYHMSAGRSLQECTAYIESEGYSLEKVY